MSNGNFKLYDIWQSYDAKTVFIDMQNRYLGLESEKGVLYAKHRIPGVLVTNKGTVIIYNEARYDPGDWSLMDVFCQRSVDHGQTFGGRIYLTRGNAEHHTQNNPVMMQDKTGRIHFLYCEDYGSMGGHIFRRYSDDDGLTWSEKIDITQFTKPDFRSVIAFGPGHGICKPDGTILVPVWLVPKFYETPERGHGPSVMTTFYSKDNGETWQLGEMVGSCLMMQSPNESVATLLSDGTVYINSRLNNYYRGKVKTKDGFTNLAMEADKSLIDPHCFGSCASFNDGKHPFTVLFANCESKTERKNVVIKGSIDDGETWIYRRVIDADRGGYVDVNVDNQAGLIYVLYENRAGETDHLAVLDYAWLTTPEPN